MTRTMTKTPRWMTSVVAASTAPMPVLPWARGSRRKPESLRAVPPPARALAAR